MQQEIFTINARENVMLEVMQSYLSLSHSQVRRSINAAFSTLLNILESKKIVYKSLKSALVPRPDRNEAAFVFDRTAIKSNWYGFEVFERLLPVMDRRSTHSFLCGNYIGNNRTEEKLRAAFFESIELARECEYRTSNQFFIVYINNLSNTMVTDLTGALDRYPEYVGFAACNGPSSFKTHLSNTLCNNFLKHKTFVVMAHEDDRSNSENINMSGYPFEKNGYTCKSLQSSYFGLFLSYKIEREILPGFESDTHFALNAISNTVVPLDDCEIRIDENKLGYLLEKKHGSMKKTDLIHLDGDRLKMMIRDRISSNYIFNLGYSEEHETMKFNTVLSVTTADTRRLVKLTVSLEYKPETKQLRLITMF